MEKQSTLGQVWRFFRPILIIVPAAAILAGLTFLAGSKSGGFNIRAYSDRLFWAGIALIVLGGIAAVASMGSLSTLGTPSVLTAGADARNAQSRIQDHFNVNAKRYKFIARMAISGAICIAISALLEISSR